MTSLADTKWLEKTEYKPENPGYSLEHKNIRWLLWAIQFSSVAQSGPTLYNPMNRSTPGLPVHHQLPESTKTHLHWVSDAIQPLILCHPLLLLPSIFPTIRVFSNASALHIRWSKYCSFSFNISPSNEHPGQSPLGWIGWISHQSKGLLESSPTPQFTTILQQSAFFIIQRSHPYMTTGKTIALTGWTSVGKVMSLLFNMLSRLVITFLPKSKRLWISWLQSPSAVILETPK